jgi:hypothetical protein
LCCILGVPMSETEIQADQIKPGTAYELLGTNSAATKTIYLSLVGTSNEVTVTKSVATITLSTPLTSAIAYTLPSTRGTSGYFLQTDGSTAALVWAPSTGAPGGSTSDVQFNNGGVFGGDSNLTYSSGILTLGKAPVLPTSSFSASGGTITPDARLETVVIVTVDATCTINGPTNPYSGQKITFALEQDSTGHSVTFSTGSGNFRFGTDIPSFTASGANGTDYVNAIWDSNASVWDIVSVSKGFSNAAPSVIVLVNTTHAYSTGFTCPIPVSTTSAGNLLIIGISDEGVGSLVSSVTDDASNTYVQVPGAYTAGGMMSDIWYCENCNAGATVITVNFATSAAVPICSASEYSGVKLSGSFDTANHIQGGSVSPSITPSTPGELLFVTAGSSDAFLSAMTGAWVVDGYEPTVDGYIWGHYINPPLSVQSTTFTPSVSNMASSVASFLPA